MSENTGPGSAIVTPAWLAVVGGLTGNTVASFAGDVLAVHLALGLLTTAGVVALVLDRLHRR